MLLIIFLVLGYLIGSINSAIIVCKLMHLPSPRTLGSGNPGATNVLRTGSKLATGLTLLGDILKGVIALTIARFAHLPEVSLAWIALATILGHVTPIYHNFKGGKGVATLLGVLLALNLWLGILGLITWVVIAAFFRYSSLAAIIATILMPFYAIFLLPHACLMPLSLISLLVLCRHLGNILRLIKGQEKKIGRKS